MYTLFNSEIPLGIHLSGLLRVWDWDSVITTSFKVPLGLSLNKKLVQYDTVRYVHDSQKMKLNEVLVQYKYK